MKVIINGFDVTDVTRSFTPDDWDKLRSCGRHSFVINIANTPVDVAAGMVEPVIAAEVAPPIQRPRTTTERCLLRPSPQI
jgi:hypothetical protein